MSHVENHELEEIDEDYFVMLGVVLEGENNIFMHGGVNHEID